MRLFFFKFLLLLLGLIPLDTFAQKIIKKALPKPVVFDCPIDSRTLYLHESQHWEKLDAPWIVISDRDGTTTYKNPDDTSEQLEILKFKDWYYVAEEKGEWIRIFKSKISHSKLKVEGFVKDFGWVKKSELLLWNTALIDSKSSLPLKALVVNYFSDIQMIIENGIDVPCYKGPMTKYLINTPVNNDICFILKRENNRVLLSKSQNINPQISIENILGWVRQDELIMLGSNLWAEPNIETEAFKERQDNDALKVYGFINEYSASSLASGNPLDSSALCWSGDPALSKDTITIENEKRLASDAMRFPILNYHNTSLSIRTLFRGKVSNFIESSENDSFTDLNTEKLSLNKDEVYFYSEMYIPKNNKGQYPSLTYTFIIDRVALDNYINQLDRLGFAMSSPPSEIRKELTKVFEVMFDAYSVHQIPNNTSLKDFRQLIAGIKLSGSFESSKWDNLIINNLLSEKKISSEIIYELSYYLSSQARKLKKMVREMEPFKFTENSQNSYYWVPMNYLF